MKKLVSVVLLGAALAATGVVTAHSGAKSRHGGVVQSASDLDFELVPGADGAIVYVEDHGKPLSTEGMSGKLTVLNGSQKSEAELKPAGENKLEAKGVKLGPGAKAVAALSNPARKAITVRFAVK